MRRIALFLACVPIGGANARLRAAKPFIMLDEPQRFVRKGEKSLGASW